jgi:hypothetical protein
MAAPTVADEVEPEVGATEAVDAEEEALESSDATSQSEEGTSGAPLSLLRDRCGCSAAGAALRTSVGAAVRSCSTTAARKASVGSTSEEEDMWRRRYSGAGETRSAPASGTKTRSSRTFAGGEPARVGVRVGVCGRASTGGTTTEPQHQFKVSVSKDG